MPAGYAPFGIQAVTIGTTVSIIVTYAQQDSKKHANVSGAGLGLVDVFDTNGKFLQHLVATGGALNSPWGVALAPAGFGTLAKMLLIGNFGDGVINGYDPSTGAFVGSVNDSNGKPLANPGLWGIVFGNGAFNQPATTLYFAAGISAQTGGLYGRIDPGATAPDTVAPKVTLTNASGTVSGTVALTATATRQRRSGFGQVLCRHDPRRHGNESSVHRPVGHDDGSERRVPIDRTGGRCGR